MKEIKVLSNNPYMTGLSEMYPDIEFAKPDGYSLKMQILAPMKGVDAEKKRYPLIVFVQGSAWTKPNQYFEIPQLSRYASAGYVVATVTHRSAFEAKAPAFLQDVKSAIRFLRANAEKYRIDPERVAIWGTSSGGNTALLCGVCDGVEGLDVGENLGCSSAVKCVVDCFGPTDLVKMATVQYVPDENGNEPGGDGPNLFEALAGQKLDRKDLKTLEPLAAISPINYVEPGKKYPPFLILHGDADPVVLYEDSVMMAEKLDACGADVRMVRVTGAPHEGSFWSDALHEEIFAFLKENL